MYLQRPCNISNCHETAKWVPALCPGHGCEAAKPQPCQEQLMGWSDNESLKGKCFRLLGRGGTDSKGKILPFPSAPVKFCQLPLLSMHNQVISACCAARRRHSQMLHWHRILDHHLDNVPRGQELSQGYYRSPRASLQKVVGYLIAVITKLSHALLMQAAKRSFKPQKSLNVWLALNTGGV